ncbi:MAG: DUF192 domain-containing protein [Candidatus Micrarchaeales archaeon]|nr:DUF192 domain-containing protein [Candidatus Micrarchaeales archaeon]
MNKPNFTTVAIIAAALLIVVILVLSQGESINKQAQLDSYFGISHVLVISNNSTENYTVYVASNISQQEQGYMNQTSIGDCGGEANCLGMLFPFGYQGEECFWMKNTEIPLKQMWIAGNGLITYSADAVPYSTSVICANGSMVLETAPSAGISVGDRVVLVKAP